VVNRSEADDRDSDALENSVIRVTSRPRRDDMEFNELDVRLRVSYKTLLLVFVLFDVFHKVASTLIDSPFFQDLIP